MKKLFVLTLILSLLLITATPALARGGRGGGGGRKGGGGGGVKMKLALLEGTITAIDTQAETITINVVCGNKQSKQYVGQTLTISTTSATQFLQQNAGQITFSDLAVDQQVRAEAGLANGIWTAKRITSGVAFKCAGGGGGNGGGAGSVKARPIVLEGTITAVDAGALAVTFTVVCGNKPARPYIGQSLTLATTSDTVFLQQGGGAITFADLAVDQKVRVEASLADAVWTASRITSGVALKCVVNPNQGGNPYP